MRQILLLAIILICNSAFGQSYYQKYISASSNVSARNIIMTNDGGHAICGNTGLSPNIEGYVVKLDNAGNLVWANSYKEADFTLLSGFAQTFDGGYILAGRAGFQTFKWLIIKLNSTGGIQWSYTYNNGNFDQAYSVIQTADSGYAITGRVDAGFSSMSGIIKLDKTGAVQWMASPPGFNDGAYSIVQTPDQGFVVGGTTTGSGTGTDIIFSKLSSAGNTLWTTTVGGTGHDQLFPSSRLVLANDGGVAIAGFTSSFGAGNQDAYIIKLNAAGSLVWTRVIGTANAEYGFNLVQTTDHGYLVAGSTSSNGYDGTITRLDSNGVFQWIKNVGTSGGEEFYSVALANDGGFVAAGNGGNIYLVKFDANGNTCGATAPAVNSSNGGTATVVSPAGSIGGATLLPANPVATSGGSVSTICSCQIVAGITAAGPTTFCTGGNVTLNANIAGGITYQWYRNSVLISGAVNASYVASTSGSYTVVETSNCGSSTSNSIAVTVNAAPVAVISAGGPTTFCSGGNVTLNANGGGGITYQWYRNTVIISGAVNSTYIANTAGSYSVTETSSCGTSTSNSIAVNVNTAPTAAITASGPTTFCSGGSVVLDANTGGGLTYQWYLNSNAISNAVNSSYVANASGNYTVVVSNNCGSTTSNSINVTVNSVPAAVISAGGHTTFCSGGSVTLFANNIANTTYQWYLNGTMIAAATNTTYSANASGNYTVTEKSQCGTVTSNIIVVTVNPLPSATITPSGNVGFCTSGITLQANTGTGLAYQWKRNNVNISGATAASYLANLSGSYSVLVTSSSGCSRASAQVNVSGPPSNTITASGPTTFCTGGNVTLNCLSDQPVTYLWKKNGATINGATGQTYTATSAGKYGCIVTNNYGCTKISNQINVSVGPPDATITANGSTSFCAGGNVQLSAVSGYSYQWLKNGSNIFGAVQQTYTATTAGKYKVTVTDQWGCTKTTSNSGQITVSVPCRAGEKYSGAFSAISIIPNPSDGDVELLVSSEKEIKVILQIYSQSGKLIMEQAAETNIPFLMDLTLQPDGLYFIRAIVGDDQFIQKLVKL